MLKHYDVRLMTYGTPHKGTPLANAGKRIFSALLAGGRTALLASGGAALGSVFSWDPPSLAGKLLLKGILPKGFPPGLDAMRPESDFIGSLSAVTEPYPLRTWGAKCEVDGLPSGTFAFAIRDAIYGAFGGSANDTVVGAASATGAGKAQKIFDACHTSSAFRFRRSSGDSVALVMVEAPRFTRSNRIRVFAACTILAAIVSAFVIRVSRDMRDLEVPWTAEFEPLSRSPFTAEDEHYQFKCLPAFAVLAIPLGMLPIQVAKGTWFVGSVVLLIALIVLSIRLLPEQRKPTTILVVNAIVVLAKFYARELDMGQVNLPFAMAVTGRFSR